MSVKKKDAAADPQAEGQAGSKTKKINKMTLAEVEAELAECREKQGGLVSRYARQLLSRKKVLTSGGKASPENPF